MRRLKATRESVVKRLSIIVIMNHHVSMMEHVCRQLVTPRFSHFFRQNDFPKNRICQCVARGGDGVGGADPRLHNDHPVALCRYKGARRAGAL